MSNECRRAKCDKEIFKYHLCRYHYYSRKTFYKYQGHLAELKIEQVERKCLQCDEPFMSMGNRKCNSCNSVAYDEINNDVSFYVSC